MFLEAETSSTHISPMSLTLATQPAYHAISSFLELTYDVLCCIIDELSPRNEPNHEALSALALANSALLDMCRRKQFGTMRDGSTCQHVLNPFVDLLDKNNNLQKYIYSIFSQIQCLIY